MVSPDNILMYLLPEQEAQIKEIFVQLAERGFPQQNQNCLLYTSDAADDLLTV